MIGLPLVAEAALKEWLRAFGDGRFSIPCFGKNLQEASP
jgi:hypothetical protein